jgi:hypothetical protein
MKFKNFFFISILCILLISCDKYEKYGTIEIYFSHTVDENPIQFNQLIYKNAAGNQYQVNEVKYFISRIFLNDVDGKSFEIKQGNGIHYVDCSLDKTLRLKIENIPQKNYVYISFIFGLDEDDNKSNRFVNSPECNFSWPDALGGGYHYMQINGKFLNSTGDLQNMNIHTGIGQLRDDDNEITQFVHNYFAVNLPVRIAFDESYNTHINLNMEIQRWFDTPNIYNFNDFGTGIMQNQRAQELLKENGKSVWSSVSGIR